MKTPFPDVSTPRAEHIPSNLIRQIQGQPVCGDLYPSALGQVDTPPGTLRERPEGWPDALFLYSLSGQGRVQSEDSDWHPVPSGHAVLIPPNTPFCHQADSDTFWKLYWLHFNGSRLQDYLQILPGTRGQRVFPLFTGDLVQTFFTKAYEMIEEGLSSNRMLLLGSDLKDLLCRVAYAHEQIQSGEQGEQSEIHRVLKIMRGSLSTSFSLHDLADMAGMSTTRFCREFKNQTGSTPVQYHDRLRIQHAARRLLQENVTVSQVSDELNFANPYHFSRKFKTVIGLSPSEYRKQHPYE